MSDNAEAFVLPGFMPRKTFAERMNRCDRTVKRMQDRGEIIVTYFGNQPFVDLEKTLARRRGEDKRGGRGRGS
jgi:hypothetical protein